MTVILAETVVQKNSQLVLLIAMIGTTLDQLLEPLQIIIKRFVALLLYVAYLFL